MTGDNRLISELDVLAYADGLLHADPTRETEVETYLHEHPTEAARVRAYKEQNAQLRARFAPVLEEAVPARLSAALEPRVGGGGVWRGARFGIAASLLLAVGAVGGWLGATMHRHSAQVPDFLRQAAVSYKHSEHRGPAVLARVNSGARNHLSTPTSPELQAPDLSAQGYTLVERRAMTRGDRQAVRYVYANSQGRRLDLVSQTRWQQGDKPRLHTLEEGKVRVAYWFDGPLVYGLVGQLDRHELKVLAKAVRGASPIIPQFAPQQIKPTVLSGAEARTSPSEDSPHVDTMRAIPAGSM